MSKVWIVDKMTEFVRDFFRDFCDCALTLEEQFSLFDEIGWVDFHVLQDLLGSEMSKGLLWRLKDTSHHVFQTDPIESPVGQFLDWGIGYIFHETLKLKEDAYQHLTYAPRFDDMQSLDLPPLEREVGLQLVQVLSQTKESMFREISRIRFILSQCQKLMPEYLNFHQDNLLLARFIYAQQPLVKSVFKERYDSLIASIYENKPELLYVYASQSLRLGGWVEQAMESMNRAYEINPKSLQVVQEMEVVDNWSKSL
jgi:hypothetical protein